MITKKRLLELIKDEEMATKEYLEIYKNNPRLTKFNELSKDEDNHAKYLKALFYRLYINK